MLAQKLEKIDKHINKIKQSNAHTAEQVAVMQEIQAKQIMAAKEAQAAAAQGAGKKRGIGKGWLFGAAAGGVGLGYVGTKMFDTKPADTTTGYSPEEMQALQAAGGAAPGTIPVDGSAGMGGAGAMPPATGGGAEYSAPPAGAGAGAGAAQQAAAPPASQAGGQSGTKPIYDPEVQMYYIMGPGAVQQQIRYYIDPSTGYLINSVTFDVSDPKTGQIIQRGSDAGSGGAAGGAGAGGAGAGRMQKRSVRHLKV